MHVYILKLKDGTFYTGITSRLRKRMEEHKRGASKSTRYKLPAKMVWLNEVRSREEGRVLEVKIKGRGARRFMRTYIQGNWGTIAIDYINEEIFEK